MTRKQIRDKVLAAVQAIDPISTVTTARRLDLEDGAEIIVINLSQGVVNSESMTTMVEAEITVSIYSKSADDDQLDLTAEPIREALDAEDLGLNFVGFAYSDPAEGDAFNSLTLSYTITYAE
ncbi:MAG: hypothetical protein CME36_09705 [unclassified Hahellaceae]|nr:hypothetical protein [Hahellaceae bacterium]|tara:strand:- start:36730 stop:37095 length:366 start_codon:yes stop_codon:yes gene_type:complete